MPSLAGRVLVDTHHPRCGHFPFGQCVDQAQDRASADGDAEHLGQAGTGPACEGETDGGQR
ncbi:hypothetical protein OG936_32685 [Streptomyces sp. NBC_00846]|uniref:hypothetical protein n=1 Tax=Streptomyces sp. NBC_00846 TaxID=2975849 RepID=UPI00386CA86F|nr:hypothetical protein OG936_32685 [Streptomyces sp. NBC_00846]